MLALSIAVHGGSELVFMVEYTFFECGEKLSILLSLSSKKKY